MSQTSNPSTPLPEQGGFNEKLDAILEDYGDYVYFEGDPKRSGTMDNQTALANIRTLVLEEIIGEDEPEYSLDNPSWGSNRTRNKFRAEQRKKLGGTHGTK